MGIISFLKEMRFTEEVRMIGGGGGCPSGFLDLLGIARLWFIGAPLLELQRLAKPVAELLGKKVSPSSCLAQAEVQHYHFLYS
jgi:hypothetical protein